MTEKEREQLLSRIEQEGFDYCFMAYSEFKEIKDSFFHKLREEYQRSQRKLMLYIETGINFEDN